MKKEMMNFMLALKASIYVTCIHKALATASHLARPIVGVEERIYNLEVRQKMKVIKSNPTSVGQ